MQNNNLSDRRDSNCQRILLTAREAAQSLRISERLLWTLTDRGDIRCIRMNASKRYPIDELERFVARQLLEQNPSAANPSVDVPDPHLDNNQLRKKNDGKYQY